MMNTRKLATPYVELIQRQLQHLLKVIDFEYQGAKVEVNGFRLKNLSQWVVPTKFLLWDNLGAPSSSCNCDCEFCYEQGHSLPMERSQLLLEEVRTRIKYYDSLNRYGLPVPLRLYKEPFCNPQLLEFLQLVRQAVPHQSITLTTNGGFLSEEEVRELAELRPIAVVISVNSADRDLRQKTMRDHLANSMGIDCIPLLRKYEIQFVGSIVAWPSYPLQDIEHTVRFLHEHEALLIRILLPGYTRYNAPGMPFSTEEQWPQVVELGKRLRAEIDTPLQVQPSLYWIKTLRPRVDGVFRNSPAARAGICTNDLILQVNGQRVFTRSQAENLLRHSVNPEEDGQTLLQVQRGDTVLEFRLSDDSCIADDRYPFKPRGYSSDSSAILDDGEVHVGNLGLFFVEDFRISYLEKVKQLVENYQAQRILLLSSRLVKPALEKALKMVDLYSQYFAEKEFHVEVPEHSFWGGNIMLGDLYMVSDYVQHIRGFIEKHRTRPDLILIPSSFANEWGFDLLGRSYREIEWAFGVPTELVPCKRIYQ